MEYTHTRTLWILEWNDIDTRKVSLRLVTLTDLCLLFQVIKINFAKLVSARCSFAWLRCRKIIVIKVTSCACLLSQIANYVKRIINAYRDAATTVLLELCLQNWFESINILRGANDRYEHARISVSPWQEFLLSLDSWAIRTQIVESTRLTFIAYYMGGSFRLHLFR